MKLKNKEKFLKTEFGSELECVCFTIDFYLAEQKKCPFWNSKEECEKHMKLQIGIDNLFAQLEIFKLALKQFYHLEYCLIRTDEYFGLCTKDETDWLFKKYKRNKKSLEHFKYVV